MSGISRSGHVALGLHYIAPSPFVRRLRTRKEWDPFLPFPFGIVVLYIFRTHLQHCHPGSCRCTVAAKHVVSNLDQRHCRAFLVTSGVESTGTVGVFRSPEAQLPLFPGHLHRLHELLQRPFVVRMICQDTLPCIHVKKACTFFGKKLGKSNLKSSIFRLSRASLKTSVQILDTRIENS